MSSANRTQIRYGVESTWGEIPSIAFTNFGDTSDSLSYNISTIQSETIRSDRKIEDLIQTGANPGGTINFELRYGGPDDFLESALYNSWSSDLSISGSDISFDGVGNTIDSTSTDFSSVKAGQWIKVSGSSNNDGFWHVSAVAQHQLIITDGTLTTESSGSSISITGSILTDGTTEKSFTIEREHQDKGQFFHWTGMVVSQLAMKVAANSVVTGTLTFIGKTVGRTTSTVGTGAPNQGSTEDVMNAVANVGNIMEGGSVISDTFIQSVDFSVNNNVRGLSAIGVLGNADLAEGDCDVKGNMSIYFADGSMYDKFINNTTSSFSFRVTKNNKTYIFTFPRIKFSSDDISVPGKNQDVMENMGFQAIVHPTYGWTMQIDRFGS